MSKDIIKLNEIWKDKYEVTDYITSGGFGKIYHGYDLSNNNPIIIKEVPIEENSNSIEQHIKNLIDSDNEFIIKIYDTKLINNNLYIVQEYFDGITLTNFISQNYYPAELIINIIIQITQGLNLLSKHNIIHNDLKPDNILINQNYQIKIIDFGLSNVDYQNINWNEKLKISLRFASPDYFFNKAISIQNDLHSLGVIFYFCLMGDTPFNDVSDDFYMYKWKQANCDFISNYRIDVPVKIDHIIFKLTANCLNQDIYHYTNYDDLLVDLLSWNKEPTRLIYNDVFIKDIGPKKEKKSKLWLLLLLISLFIILFIILIIIISIYAR